VQIVETAGQEVAAAILCCTKKCKECTWALQLAGSLGYEEFGRSLLMEANCLAPIVAVMVENRGNQALEAAGCRAIANIAISAVGQVSLAREAAHLALIGAMNSHASDLVQKNGAAALRNLATTKANRVDIIKSGGVMTLLNAITRSGIVSASDAARAAATGADMSQLMEQRDQASQVAHLALEALAAVVAENLEESSEMSKYVETVLMAMQHHVPLADVQTAGCQALAAYAGRTSSFSAMAQIDAQKQAVLETLTQSIAANTEEPATVAACCDTISKLPECVLALFLETEGVPAVTWCIRQFPNEVEVVEAACAALGALSGFPGNKTVFWDQQVPSLLHEVMTVHYANKHVEQLVAQIEARCSEEIPQEYRQPNHHTYVKHTDPRRFNDAQPQRYTNASGTDFANRFKPSGVSTSFGAGWSPLKSGRFMHEQMT